MPWEVILPVLLAAADAPGDARQRLMNKIEASVRLPKGARSLNGYARYYAYRTPDKVLAVYVIPSPPPDNRGCAVVMKDMGSRPCTQAEIKEMIDSFAERAARQLPAGKRRWLRSPHDMPNLSDGGCRQVTIEYSIAANRFLVVQCNGLG